MTFVKLYFHLCMVIFMPSCLKKKKLGTLKKCIFRIKIIQNILVLFLNSLNENHDPLSLIFYII